jgi:hypothetical protein
MGDAPGPLAGCMGTEGERRGCAVRTVKEAFDGASSTIMQLRVNGAMPACLRSPLPASPAVGWNLTGVACGSRGSSRAPSESFNQLQAFFVVFSTHFLHVQCHKRRRNRANALRPNTPAPY